MQNSRRRRNGMEKNPSPLIAQYQPTKNGRKSQSKPKNLFDRFIDYKNDILRFMHDFKVPQCMCGLCSTYIECREETVFCLSTTGKSKCIKEEKGCLCPGCPVHEKMGFKYVYYCIRGDEKDQLAKK
jgi:hypothetical protein